MKSLLKDEYDDYLACFDSPQIHSLRVNTSKISVDRFKEIFPYNLEQVPWCKDGFYFDDLSISKHPYYYAGLYYLQEASAMLPAEVLPIEEGDIVLDACAAPGGKSLKLLDKLNNTGLLISNDISISRANALLRNIERAGFSNYYVIAKDIIELEEHFPKYFDKILLDAPCSGEGMFRKEPTGIEYWSPEYPAECANRQQKILASAMKMLKPGGTIVYSTCTFAPEEDEQNISWLLNNYPDLKLIPIEKASGMDDGRPEWADGNEELKKTVRLFPHHLKGEGHFIAKLVNGEPESTDKKRKKKNKRKKQSIVKPDKEQVKLFNQFITSVFPDYQPHQLILFGDQLYDLPLEEDKIEGLNVLRPGLHLGTFKKNRFEPALAWALASLPQEANQVIELSQEQWHQYVHGDVINIDADLPNGWYLLVCEEHTAGFGKLVGKTIKNFYPKGLRF